MADLTIGQLTKAAEMTDDALLPLEQGGEARVITGALIKQYARDSVQPYADAAESAAGRAEAAAGSAEASAESAQADASDAGVSAASAKEDAAKAAASEAVVQASANAAAASEANAAASAAAAAASQSAAAASESNAKASENAAAASAGAAKTSETNAAASETAASHSAGEASSSASAAANSAENAKESADAAAAHESAAAKSDAGAAASASAASASQSAAKISETNAKTSESNAKASETAAAASETASAESASAASASAGAAKDSENAAKASESAAALSASQAADSASSASGSAEEAANSADAASASESATEAAKNAAQASEAAAKASETASKASETAAKASETASKQSETSAAGSASAAQESASNAADSATAAAQSAASIGDAEQVVTQKAAEASASAESAAQSAEAAARSAEQAAEVVGGNFATKSEAQGYADTAESNAKKYADQQIAAIPTPDVPTKVSELENDSGYLTSYTETDPTVPAWAKADNKPTYTASEVGADASGSASQALADAKSYTDKQIAAIPTPDVSGQINTHNTNTKAHNDIRELIIGLTNRMNALADSDDTTLDQLSEIVAYIKNNKSLIDGITTSKVNVADIIDNLTTNVSDKPLSAAQGVALKALIDAITVPKKVSELENDSGYLTSYTETDPTVPSWAKASSKPTYTASEVGATPASHASDATIHITDNERTVWNAQYSETNPPPYPVTSVNGQTGNVTVEGSIKTYTVTIGTTWTENADTGVKSQSIAIAGVLAKHTAKVDHAYTGDGTSDGYAAFVEEENQYLTYITNGYAETYDGGITFYIFGDAPTVSIPIVVEVA